MIKKKSIIFNESKTLSNKLAHDILLSANKYIKKNGRFTIVLAGGKSFLKTYQILKNSKSDWSKWHIFFGDERCLPINSTDRNDQQILKAWLDNRKIPEENINFIPVELGTKHTLLFYEKLLERIQKFDLVLLGMGEDGHTASLFPNHNHQNNKSVIVVRNSPKNPKDRISLSYSRLNKSKNVYKLICGSSKSKALKLWFKGKVLPISKINGDFEKIYICNELQDSIAELI